VRSVEAAARPGLRRARQAPDQRTIAQTGGHPQIGRLSAEQLDDLAMAPEQRHHERGTTVPPGRHLGARTRGQHHVRKL
jgi:hypothetical protein